MAGHTEAFLRISKRTKDRGTGRCDEIPLRNGQRSTDHLSSQSDAHLPQVGLHHSIFGWAQNLNLAYNELMPVMIIQVDEMMHRAYLELPGTLASHARLALAQYLAVGSDHDSCQPHVVAPPPLVPPCIELAPLTGPLPAKRGRLRNASKPAQCDRAIQARSSFSPLRSIPTPRPSLY